VKDLKIYATNGGRQLVFVAPFFVLFFLSQFPSFLALEKKKKKLPSLPSKHLPSLISFPLLSHERFLFVFLKLQEIDFLPSMSLLFHRLLSLNSSKFEQLP
jgi:hypothetical protein